MAYNAAIPQPADQLSVSQGDLLNNFGALNTFVSINHVGFNTADAGKHSQITFPLGPLAGQPFTYNAGEIGLQSLNQAPTSVPDIWMTRGAGTAIPITGKLGNSTDGWSYLPSGILLKWGTRTTLAAGADIATFPVAAGYPVFTAVYAVFVTPRSNITVYTTGALTTTTTTTTTSAAGTYNFLVIGA